MNAADRSQVKNAERKDAEKRKLRLAQLRNILGSEAGRDVLWWFLEECGVFQSVCRPGFSVEYHAGKQDFGHFIQKHILDADDAAYFKMLTKNWRTSAKPANQTTAEPAEGTPAADGKKGEENDAEQ